LLNFFPADLLLTAAVNLLEKITGQRQSWKTPDKFGVSKPMECDIFLQCFDTVGWATGRASGLLTNWMLVCWW